MGERDKFVRVPPAVRAFAAVGMVLAVCLGIWQLRRDGERNEGRAIAMAVADLPALGDADPVDESSAWRMVAWTGRFDGTPELIGGRMEGDALGYGVAQRFLRADGFNVLVDRGWVPADAAADAVVGLVSVAETRLVGQLRPARGSAVAAPVAGHGSRIWPAKAWPSILKTMEGGIYGELYVVAGLTSEAFVEKESTPKGSVVGVPVRDDTSLHYASQWFGISLVLGIVLVPAAITRARHFLGA
ncbi:hypothetical protein LBMAG42_23090 [Deltaproteobacteria bacterium]|nr:hypothetical protein LBMAG42_23090 [Deltaproteobacteria bacterium]